MKREKSQQNKKIHNRNRSLLDEQDDRSSKKRRSFFDN